MRLALAILVAGCGDNLRAIDASAPAPPPCSAMFSGNFAETLRGAADCPTVADTSLAFSLAAMHLAVPLAIAIDLGPEPSPGEYSSETTQSWSATAYAHDAHGGGGACQYTAGSSSTPQGSFTMTLSAIDAQTAHGTLAITQYVLTSPSTECGNDASNELVSLAF